MPYVRLLNEALQANQLRCPPSLSRPTLLFPTGQIQGATEQGPDPPQAGDRVSWGSSRQQSWLGLAWYACSQRGFECMLNDP